MMNKNEISNGVNSVLDGQFYNPTLGNLRLEEMLEQLTKYMTERPDKAYEVIVGCDSASGLEPHFPVAVVILRKGEGGRFFLKKIKYPRERKFYHWRQRILEEVLLSCDLALALKDKLIKAVNNLAQRPNYQFLYIHADIGQQGGTKDMIKEVTGLIIGNGFEPKIKPDSFAASVVADRYS